MLNLNEINDENTFDLKQTKTFLKAIKGHKYECYFKLIMTYQLSRIELVCLEWNDIDFENNTITIYHITQNRSNKVYYKWNVEKRLETARTFPLLPDIKNLLLELQEKQIENSILRNDYSFNDKNFVALKDDGTRLNYNTLSRNLRNVGKDNDLPEIELSGLKNCLDDYICQKTNNYNYFCAWTRRDTKIKMDNLYKDFNLFRNKRFLNNLNDLLDIANHSHKSNMEM